MTVKNTCGLCHGTGRIPVRNGKTWTTVKCTQCGGSGAR